jgi:hypothetical protein
VLDACKSASGLDEFNKSGRPTIVAFASPDLNVPLAGFTRAFLLPALRGALECPSGLQQCIYCAHFRTTATTTGNITSSSLLAYLRGHLRGDKRVQSEPTLLDNNDFALCRYSWMPTLETAAGT